MTAVDPLAPERVAARIAPVIDRLRLAVARRTNQHSVASNLRASAGVSEPSFQLFSMTRNAYPSRVVSMAQLGAPFVYQRSSAVATNTQELLDANLVEREEGTSVRLSDSGRALMERLHVAGSEAVAELWGADETLAQALLPLADRALRAAMASGGDGFGLMAPPYDVAGASAAVQLSERLAGLRFHRFDAHVAAWSAVGLSAQEVKALLPGPQREAVEDETNRRAGAPYAPLTPAERLDLLAGLGALPGGP